MSSETTFRTEFECKRCGLKQVVKDGGYGEVDDILQDEYGWIKIRMEYSSEDFGAKSVEEDYCRGCAELFMKDFKLEREELSGNEDEEDCEPIGSPSPIESLRQKHKDEIPMKEHKDPNEGGI